MDAPETMYARAPDGTYVAYQVIGDGPDLLYIPGSWSNSALSWEQPLDAAFLRSLASFSRLILVDRRGTGRSDPVHPATPPLEVQVGDVESVMDAVACDRAAIFGVFESGPMCALFSAAHPERTESLILYATYARGAWAPDYPWAWTDDEFAEDLATIEKGIAAGWEGTHYLDDWIREAVPSLADDPAARPWLVKNFQLTHGPGSTVERVRMEHETDIRAVLPSIQSPTLVLHRRGDQMANPEEGRWLATQIPDATFVELEGKDHPPWAGDQHSVLEQIGKFLGVRYEPAPADRVLATVLFTDIVGSTAQLAARGDAGWKELLARHDEIAKDEIQHHRGRYVASTGDGLLATLDGPALAIRCARAIQAGVRDLGIEIRAGVHTGEVELAGTDVRGIAVHIGARVGALAGASEVLVSQTVKDLAAGSGLLFEDAGEHELKGVPDRWHLYRVVNEGV